MQQTYREKDLGCSRHTGKKTSAKQRGALRKEKIIQSLIEGWESEEFSFPSLVLGGLKKESMPACPEQALNWLSQSICRGPVVGRKSHQAFGLKLAG